MSAQIDGVQWTAACVRVATNNVNSLGYVEIGGTDNIVDPLHARDISFIVFATEPAAYLLGGRSPVGMGSSAGLQIDCQPHGACQTWGVAPCCGGALDGGSGLITITELTATRASGTFSFNLVGNPATGTTGVKVVTNGRFDVRF